MIIMPRISVIVPVYNVEKYLKRCVDSILAQTFTDFELILVDDGSPDNCGKICDDYARKDKRIQVIHQENGGLSAARNVGIDWAFENSNSQWISFVDSDDWIHPRMLEELLRAAIKYNVSVSICDMFKTNGTEPVIESANKKENLMNTEDAYAEKFGIVIPACGKLYRKESFCGIRYPIKKLHEDAFTTYKILFQFSKIVVIDCPYYCYFQNANSIMHSEWSPKRLDEVEAYRSSLPFFEKNNLLRAYRRQAYAYLWVLCNQISEISQLKNKAEFSKYEYNLRKQLKSEIRIYRKVAGINFSKDKFIYEVAYPKMMKGYWLYNSLLKKVMKGKEL